MAKATVKTEKTVTLELTGDEAQVIHDILWHGVTGSSATSRRGLSDAIVGALRRGAGLDEGDVTDIVGTLEFRTTGKGKRG
jgi:hypothetical protein